MGKLEEDGKSGIPMIGLPEDVGGAAAGLEAMRRRAQWGDPEAALHILNHIVPDIPADEEDQP